MFAFLLLPVVQGLENQVCLNISGGNTSLQMENLVVKDEPSAWSVGCSLLSLACFIHCSGIKNSSDLFPNGSSSVCHPVTVSESEAGLEFNMSGHGANCSVVFCNKRAITQLLNTLTARGTKISRLRKMHELRNMCAELFGSCRALQERFLDLERHLILSAMAAIKTDPGRLWQCNLKDLMLHVAHVTDHNLSYAGGDWILMPTVTVLPSVDERLGGVWLPVDALSIIPEKRRVVGLVEYMSANQFCLEKQTVVSLAIRIEMIGEKPLKDLNTSVDIVFKDSALKNVPNDSLLQCHFFNEKDYCWDTDGCETLNSDTGIKCRCNHTTPFGVLLLNKSLPQIHWRILSYISYLGCSLSAFFTALSLLLYFFNRKPREDHSLSIHASLCAALFLLNTCFLLTEWGSTAKPGWVCQLIAAVMHYALLCSFTWMAVEALHLYLMLVKVYNNYFRRYLLKLSLVGWGVPCVIVAVAVGVKDVKQFYGFTSVTMIDTNQTSAICWITDDTFLYGLNLSYFAIIFLFNSGVLLTVACQVCRLHGVFGGRGAAGRQDPSTPCAIWRSGTTIFGLTCLLGSSWSLALLGLGITSYSILYLFCIVNSTQGFFIFLWVCCTTRKERKRAMEAKTISTFTSDAKS